MIKTQFGSKLCKISNLPYQGFRWKAGPQGRYKETIISFTVAKERNICQTCLMDMQFGLPVGVRDQMLKNNSSLPADLATGQAIALPESDVGIRYHYQNLENNIDNIEYNPNNSVSSALQNQGVIRELDDFNRRRQEMDRKNKTSFRNLPKLCSFWVNGACGRVGRKTCPYRPCCGVFVFPELAGTKGAHDAMETLIKDLNKDGPAAVMTTLSKEVKQFFRDSQKGNREKAIKNRVMGEDDLSKKYLNRIRGAVSTMPKASMLCLLHNNPLLRGLCWSNNFILYFLIFQSKAIDPPEDEFIKTLWIGNVEAIISEQDLFDAFYSFGPITGIVILRPGKCAFVEFSSRESAEQAAKTMYNCLSVKGYSLNVNWAKPKTDAGSTYQSSNTQSYQMPAPPGMEGAAVGAYALPHMPVAAARPPAPPFPPGLPPSASGDAAAATASCEEDGQVSKKQRVEENIPQALKYDSMNPSNY